MPVSSDDLGFATRQIHAGAELDDSHRPRATPIYLTAGFVFDDFEQANERFVQSDDGYSYTRVGNPTNTAVERRIADLEGGIGALLVGSGQAAVSTAVLALAGAGDHLVSATSIYEGSRELFRDNLARLGITTSFVADANDPAAWEAAIRPETRALFAESIPNPKNDLLDIRAVAAVARRHGIPLIIDNTLATPYLLRPIEHGADIVVHSASKFLAGHGTVLGGVIVDAGRIDWAAAPARYPHLAINAGFGRTHVRRALRTRGVPRLRTIGHRAPPGPVAVPVQCVLHPAGHRDPVAPRAAPLRVRAADRRLARGSPRGRVRRLQRAGIEPVSRAGSAVPAAGSGFGLRVHAARRTGCREDVHRSRCSCSPA